MELYDLIIIGGGQSALACAYFLRRTNLKYLILDDQSQSGGAWQHTWDSLTLFSPAQYSSLPGWMMPKSEGPFPSKQDVISYLRAYQERYGIEISHGTKVKNVTKSGEPIMVKRLFPQLVHGKSRLFRPFRELTCFRGSSFILPIIPMPRLLKIKKCWLSERAIQEHRFCRKFQK